MSKKSTDEPFFYRFAIHDEAIGGEQIGNDVVVIPGVQGNVFMPG